MRNDLLTFATLGAVCTACLTAAGYLVVWSFLWPYGLQNHIGDLPFQTYIGYGLDVLGKSRSALASVDIVLAIGVLRFFTRSDGSYCDLYVTRGKNLSFIGYITLSMRTHNNGYFGKKIVPFIQWGCVACFILVMTLSSGNYGSSMAINLTHGKDIGAANGVSIARSNNFVTDGKVGIKSGKPYVIVLSASEGIYAAPVVPGASDISKTDVAFIQRRHLLGFTQTRDFIGRCVDCLLPSHAPYELMHLPLLVISLGYAAYREYRRYGNVRGEYDVIAFTDIDSAQFHLAEQLFIAEVLRRGRKLRLTVTEGLRSQLLLRPTGPHRTRSV